jgi:hypothetical protein
MEDERNTLEFIAEHFLLAMEPLTSSFSSEESFKDFLADLGWNFNSVPAAINSLKAPVTQTQSAIAGEGAFDLSAIREIVKSLTTAIKAIYGLKDAAGLAVEFKDEFPGQLVQYLLVEYLLNHQPKTGNLLRTLGIIRLEDIAASGSRPAYEKRVFAFSDLGTMFSDPLVFFRNGYHWGESAFSGELLINNIYELLTSWGFSSYPEVLDETTLDQLNQGAKDPENTYGSVLKISFLEDSTHAAKFNIGVSLFILPETATSMPGFALLPFATGDFSETFNLTEFLSLGVEGELDLSGGIGILVRPDKDIELNTGFGSGSPSSISGKLGILITLSNPEEPFTIIGSPQASRLEIAGISTKGGLRFHTGGKYEVFTEFGLEKGKIVVKPDPDEADSFLAKLLPEDGIQLEFDLTVGFSTSQGIYFAGSGGLEIALPVHLNLGPIDIDSATIAIKAKSESGTTTIPVELGATIKADFSVLKAVVENIGLKANFTFPKGGNGNLGPLDLSLGFKPPAGVGLSVDAGVVKGGGYLYLDYDRGEYAGALELTFSEIVSLKAIGIITTRMPDGSKGFSLLIIITAEFGSGLQLGFGFVLLGVGGLLGLNRTMRLQLLADGVRSGGVNGIMFPTNVVENAPKIISDLKTYFPAEEGKFLIGPMAKLGWGTPALISVSLGIIFEIPGNIAILGIIKVALPTEQSALLILQVNFIGAIEFDKERLWFFASLYNSRVLFITIEGEMGLLIGWGNNPNFVTSVGGFHPMFNPPPLPFPSPKRLSFNILNESWGKIRVMGYFAVTSNTAQFGAQVELYFGFSVLSIEGSLGFDALFQFSPFWFIIQISCSFSVKVFGMGLFSVRVKMSLEGPTPWRAKGTGSISFLFFDIDVDFDKTWGDNANTTLPPIEAFPLVLQEVSKLENWKALPPSGNSIGVTLRKIEAEESEEPLVVLHPLGTLEFRQRMIPLNITLDKIGNQKPSDANKFNVAPEGGTLKEEDILQEKFAMAQFRDMESSQKLSIPSFQDLDAGMSLSAEGTSIRTGKAVKRVVRYELVTIDNQYKHNLLRFVVINASLLFRHFLLGNAAAKSFASQRNKKELKPKNESISILQTGFSVAFTDNNKAVNARAVSFRSEALAREYLNGQINLDPNLAGNIHVVPQTELNTAS